MKMKYKHWRNGVLKNTRKEWKQRQIKGKMGDNKNIRKGVK
jgi:hypothetical protein